MLNSMKKVRFETPDKCFKKAMEDAECHSPRPYIEKQLTNRPELYHYPRLLPYSPDPVLRYECSNSSPYPVLEKTNVENICNSQSRWPSHELELSMLDSWQTEPRQPVLFKKQVLDAPTEGILNQSEGTGKHIISLNESLKVLSSIENTKMGRPKENHAGCNNFFIKRDNLMKNHGFFSTDQYHFPRLNVQKENNPLTKKLELMTISSENDKVSKIQQTNTCPPIVPTPMIPDECRCHHCVKIIQSAQCNLPVHMTRHSQSPSHILNHSRRMDQQCACMQPKPCHMCPCSYPKTLKPSPSCNCQKPDIVPDQPKNAVDKKAWMIEKYAQNNHQGGMEVEKQTNLAKDKREPTVSDLFKIIKLQNEQLQLLQDKVDKFISASSSRPPNTPVQNYVTEHVALETVDSEQHKISIGVMTSFEMVRTSTVINKEIVKQANENAQIQCNRSQISIKEVVSKSQPVTVNFLEGIMPAARPVPVNTDNNIYGDTSQPIENVNDEKTLNELSLYNVQVDNATTPLISPDQSLYLDVRDYSESEPGSDDQSNIGWTYYNKVMTHVNGVLQDSEMPSSASALFRNTKQQCVQMQIDKTNVSVTKRVKFGDDPLGIHQPHLYTATTDTSLKMNQLAAKYLKGGTMAPTVLPVPVMPKPSAMPIEMSFATKNYMERHRILQGTTAVPSRSPSTGEIPRFLDITALKQQPKLL